MTSATLNLRATVRTNEKSAYLVNPFFDLTFVCGGLVLALTAICLLPASLGLSQVFASMPLLVLAMFGTYLLSGPHTGATIFRLYGEKENRQRFQLVAYALPAVLIIATGAGLHMPVIARVEAILYLVLVQHHYMAQSYGIAMMYCGRAGMQLSRPDKYFPRAILYLAVSVAICQQFTAEFQRPSFLNISLAPMAFLPAPIVTTLQGILWLTVATFLLDQLLRLRKGEAAMPLPAMATLLACALFLSVGRSLSDLVWLFLPNFFHATQYLAVVLAYQYKKGSEKHASASLLKSVEQLGDRFGEFFLIGLALFTVLPLIISALGFPLFLCEALIFFALSLHHFGADACIWKLKDKSVHSRLIS